MTYTLEQFSAACRQILKADSGRDGRKKICSLLQEALKDEQFISTHLGDDVPERKVIYEDPELGFCILAHVYKGAKESQPHDHGPSWAIYPVPQNAPHVSAGMNPDPKLSQERGAQPSRIFRIGVNFPEGQTPNPEPLFYLGSASLPLVGLWFGTKGTDVSPWYGVYGQARGETEMSDWELVEAAREGKPGKARKVRTYSLRPGMAHLYNEGDLHSPRRTAPTRLIRIEGTNMDKVRRLPYERVG